MNLTYVTNTPQLCPVKKVLRAVFTTAFHGSGAGSWFTIVSSQVERIWIG